MVYDINMLYNRKNCTITERGRQRNQGGTDMKKIDHIGIAVQSIEKALSLYTGIFPFSHTQTEIVESQKVKVAFIDVNNTKIELLEPAGADSPIQKFIDKRGEGIHHMAFQTDDIEGDLKRLAEKGMRLIDEKPRTGAGGALVAFIHPKSSYGVLYELCQKQV